jgi:hypothetical protein
VQNILDFSVNTLEQTLNETQPVIAAKLVDGRRKRLKNLERSFKSNLKELEQRSIETCLVNNSHLENFKKKAVENNEVAKTMTKNSFVKIFELLTTFDFHEKIC